jgi:hypothetical protein
MSDAETNNLTRSLIVGGTGIALASIVSYSLALSYEMGYATTFGIPVGLIQVGKTTIVRTLFSLILGGFILFGCASTVYPLLLKGTGLIGKYVIRQSPIFMLYGALLLIYRGAGLRSTFVVPFALWLLLSIFVDFAVPLIPQRGGGTYREKLEALEEARARRDRVPLIPAISQITGGSTLVGLFLFLGLLHVFSSAIGNAEALRQTHFLVPQDQPNTVVLRMYDHTFVCAPVDPNTKELKNELILRENSPEAPLHLTWTKVGALKKAGAKDNG